MIVPGPKSRLEVGRLNPQCANMYELEHAEAVFLGALRRNGLQGVTQTQKPWGFPINLKEGVCSKQKEQLLPILNPPDTRLLLAGTCTPARTIPTDLPRLPDSPAAAAAADHILHTR